MTVILHKRSLNPAEPSLTWEEVNENWRILEDYLNSNVSIIGHQGPQGVQGDRGYQGTTFTPLAENGIVSWLPDNPYILAPEPVSLVGLQGVVGATGA